MCAAQEHRGPDSRGIHVDPGGGAGDSAAPGDRPRDGRPADLQRGPHGGRCPERRDLQLPGAARAASRAGATRFATHGDTEVIVHLYEELGRGVRRAAATGCSRSRSGTRAATAWWWRATASARSRSSTRERDGALSFASELSALLADREVPRDLDLHALDSYFAYRVRPLAPLRVQGRSQAAARLDAVLRGWTRLDRALSGGCATNPSRYPKALELHEEIRRLIRQAVTRSDDLRRPARRVPLGRHRLRDRGGRDGRDFPRARCAPSRSDSRTRAGTSCPTRG